VGVATDDEFYLEEGGEDMPNIVFLRLHFFKEGRLTEEQILFLLRKVKDIFTEEKNVLRLQSPITS
jgi:serine/threonine-protein phosphatase 2B catalytic subunit